MVTAPLETTPTHKTLPLAVVWTIVSICTLPTILSFLGMRFGSGPLDSYFLTLTHLPPYFQADAIYHSLSGSFTHTIFQWTAFCTAIFTVVLAMVHFAIKRDDTTPIIAMALFFAGCMDAFHTLAADRLIEAVADNRDLVPFTWALSQLFNSFIMAVCVGMLLMRRRPSSHSAGVPYVLAVSLSFGLIAYLIIRYCATSPWLPRTQFPDSWVTRPYDLIPLAMFLFAYVFVYRPFHRQQQTLFSHALVVSISPQIVAQLHLVFGSKALFDHHFNIAHFLKVVAYAVPLVGLVFDYIQTYRLDRCQAVALARYARQMTRANIELEDQAMALQRQREELRTFTAQLEASNRELEEFARVASHDLQEPLRKVQAFGDRLKAKCADALPDQGRDYINRMQNATERMQNLINDLLTFSRVTTRAKPFTPVDLAVIAQQVLGDLEIRIEETGGRVELIDLPTIHADATQMRQLFQNLIGNALKYRSPQHPPVVRVQGELFDNDRQCRITVADNGIGFEMKHAERIFAVFQRLHGRGEYEGTGVGLAVCRKIVERHGGAITVQSHPGEGSMFAVVLPTQQHQEVTSTCAA